MAHIALYYGLTSSVLDLNIDPHNIIVKLYASDEGSGKLINFYKDKV